MQVLTCRVVLTTGLCLCAAYVIGKDGIVKEVYNDQFGAEKHIEKALAALTA